MFQNISIIHSPRASYTNFLYSILNILEPILPISKNDISESCIALKNTRDNIFSKNLVEENKSLKLAKFIQEIVCVYYPAGLQASATRFKNSLQENTKIHAMTEDIIESCHNGVVSWETKSNVSLLWFSKNSFEVSFRFPPLTGSIPTLNSLSIFEKVWFKSQPISKYLAFFLYFFSIIKLII